MAEIPNLTLSTISDGEDLNSTVTNRQMNQMHSNVQELNAMRKVNHNTDGTHKTRTIPLSKFIAGNTDYSNVLLPDGAGNTRWANLGITYCITPQVSNRRVLHPNGSGGVTWADFQWTDVVTTEFDKSKTLQMTGSGFDVDFFSPADEIVLLRYQSDQSNGLEGIGTNDIDGYAYPFNVYKNTHDLFIVSQVKGGQSDEYIEMRMDIHNGNVVWPAGPVICREGPSLVSWVLDAGRSIGSPTGDQVANSEGFLVVPFDGMPKKWVQIKYSNYGSGKNPAAVRQTYYFAVPKGQYIDLNGNLFTTYSPNISVFNGIGYYLQRVSIY